MSISVAPWSRCATAAEDHIGWHFCQLRTESWGSSSRGLIKFGRRLGKRSLVWWHSDGRVRFWSELHGSVLPCHVSGCWWWSNGMGDIVFEPLSTNRALFKCHSLSEYNCCISISLGPQCSHLMMANSSRINCYVTKLKSSLTGFMNMTMGLLYSNVLHSLQQLSDAFMSIWTTIYGECWIMAWRIRAVLKVQKINTHIYIYIYTHTHTHCCSNLFKVSLMLNKAVFIW